MRLLHTSDWHVGRTVRGRSRTDEFEAVLAEITGIALESEVDAVLVAGDLFDHRVPGAEAEELAYRTLLDLRATGAEVLVIAGNHESQARLSAVSQVFASSGIHMIAKVRKPNAGGIIEVPSRDGSSSASVGVLPFVAEHHFASAEAVFDDVSVWPAEYTLRMSQMLGLYAQAMPKGSAHVMMAHLFASGAKVGGGEHELSVGPNFAVEASQFPKTLSYMALGHVHKAQSIKGSPCQARYSGSPLRLDFGDSDASKSVTIVEVSPGKPATAETVPLSSGRQMLTLEGSLETVIAKAPPVGTAYLRVQLKLDEFTPGVARSVQEALPDAVDVIVDYPREEEPERPTMEGMSLREKLNIYAAQRTKATGNPELILKAFDELMEPQDL